MINAINYIKLKHTLLKNYKNERIFVEIRGIVNSRMFIEKARIIINHHKIVLSNKDETNDFILEFDYLKKIEFVNISHIELRYNHFMVILEL